MPDIEEFVDGSTAVDHFEAEHKRRPDPWGVTTRWYEQRKRALGLAALPDERYGSTLEIGCSIGAMTVELAERSDRVLAIDVSETAVLRARERVAHHPGVSVEARDITAGFPEGPWDLVVMSEVGYYLDPAALGRVLADVQGSLADGATLLACHWRHPEPDFLQSGDDVHRALMAGLSLEPLVHHVEDDFLLDVFGLDGRSVASRTGVLR